MHTTTDGGLAEYDASDVTVSPRGAPSEAVPVTTTTPDASAAIDSRKMASTSTLGVGCLGVVVPLAWNGRRVGAVMVLRQPMTIVYGWETRGAQRTILAPSH